MSCNSVNLLVDRLTSSAWHTLLVGSRHKNGQSDTAIF